MDSAEENLPSDWNSVESLDSAESTNSRDSDPDLDSDLDSYSDFSSYTFNDTLDGSNSSNYASEYSYNSDDGFIAYDPPIPSTHHNPPIPPTHHNPVLEFDPVLEVEIYLQQQEILERQSRIRAKYNEKISCLLVAILLIIQALANLTLSLAIIENSEQRCDCPGMIAIMFVIMAHELCKIILFFCIILSLINYELLIMYWNWNWKKSLFHAWMVIWAVGITIAFFFSISHLKQKRNSWEMIALLFSHNFYCFLILAVDGVCLVMKIGKYLIKRRAKNQTKNWLRGFSETKKYRRWANLDEPRCSICLETYQRRDKVRKLNCQHEFHRRCIDRWVRKEKQTCPICKQKIELAISHKNQKLSKVAIV